MFTFSAGFTGTGPTAQIQEAESERLLEASVPGAESRRRQQPQEAKPAVSWIVGDLERQVD